MKIGLHVSWLLSREDTYCTVIKNVNFDAEIQSVDVQGVPKNA